VDVVRPGLVSGMITRHHVRGRILLCITPCGPRGGHETLISAFAGTVGQRSDWSLVIAASGSQRLRFQVDRLGVGDRVHLLPPASAEELPGLLSSATLIALPGLDDEVRGGELARILASGRPVLASDHPRLRYLIAPEECGLLAAPGEVAAWTEMLRRAAVSPEARQRWGANARRLACERLSWADLARDFERRLLASRNGIEADAGSPGPVEPGAAGSVR
jgi:colanic acid biosynthesis glycosyl transferase WcaI